MQKLKNKRSDILAGLVVVMFFSAGFEVQGASKQKYNTMKRAHYKIMQRDVQEKKRDFKNEVEAQRRIVYQDIFDSLNLLYPEASKRDKRKYVRSILYGGSGRLRIKQIVHCMREKDQYRFAMLKRARFSHHITNRFNPEHRQKQREYRNRSF
ncbi:MAG: hypothetical protein WBQ73_02860 [Candidatus Babeliales bacterium]